MTIFLSFIFSCMLVIYQIIQSFILYIKKMVTSKFQSCPHLPIFMLILLQVFVQISEPLRAQITGAPLEDARHLTHRYDKLHQEVEAQVIIFFHNGMHMVVCFAWYLSQLSSHQAAEVLRRRSKLRNSSVSAESSARLQNAETRLKELKSALAALGREATSAMLSVEEQQQQMTLQSLRTMVLLDSFWK